MSMFPGAGARVYRNEAGEPIGWDYPDDIGDPFDDDEFYDRDADYDYDEDEEDADADG